MNVCIYTHVETGGMLLFGQVVLHPPVRPYASVAVVAPPRLKGRGDIFSVPHGISGGVLYGFILCYVKVSFCVM